MNFAVEKIGYSSQSAAMQRARGQGRVETKQRGGRAVLASLYQEGCAKIRLPRTHSSSMEAVLINTAGGLTGGDHLSWHAEVAARGHLVVTTQACERSYRSTVAEALVENRLVAHDEAHLDWLPQETILFAGSKLRRTLEVDLSEGSSLTAVEAVILGRDAMGEQAADATFSDNWRIRRNGRLIHAEATRIAADPIERSSLSLLSNNRAFATIVHVAGTVERAEAVAMQILGALAPGSQIAASCLGERVVVRAMAQTGLALRRMIVPVLTQLNGTRSLPRLWNL